MRAKNEYKFLAEAYTQVNEGHSGPVPDWEEQAGLKDELEANRAAASRDEPLEPSWDAEWEDALADILADLANTWQEGEWGDADKESLKKYINKFIDQQLGDGQIDDGGPGPLGPPGHPAGNARPRQGASGPLGWGAERKKKFPLFY